ncbi:MAG: thiamine kinase [Enterobacterales bacterium]|jgi:thiamine kinase
MSLLKEQVAELLSSVTFLKPVFDASDFSFEDLDFRYLSDGITNENYWISLNNEQYVLRLNSPDSDRLGLNRRLETLIMEKVSGLKLIPKILFQSDQPSFRLSQWITGTTWTKGIFKQQINLNRLAEALKQLHALPHFELPTMDLLARLKHYRLMIQQRHGKLPAIENRLLSKAIKGYSNLQTSMAPCLCHNDLSSANILESQINHQSQLCFLDWEYAAVNDPLFEIAVICISNELSDADKNYLLQAYMGSNQTQDVSLTLDYWCWFYKYISLLWGLVILPENQSLPKNINRQFECLIEKIPSV